MNINFDGDFNYLEIFDKNGNEIYYEDSNGYWVKKEFDENGNQIYYENSDGYIINIRPHTIIIDGKTIELSKESFEELKKQLT